MPVIGDRELQVQSKCQANEQRFRSEELRTISRFVSLLTAGLASGPRACSNFADVKFGR